MLVLTRKANESIVIGDETVITILSVKGDKVRLGVQAPKELTVHRQEIYEAIKEENKAAGISANVLQRINLEADKLKSLKK